MALVFFVCCARFMAASAAVPSDVETLEPPQVSPSNRIALVIGNAGYQNVTRLRNPISDANAMGAALQSVGFKVLLARNLDRRGMNETIDRFLAQVEPGDEALVYYSGHGVELNGSNYLLPVDVPGLDADQERMLRAEGVNLTDLLMDLEARSARVNLVILDACRDNPFRSEDASGRTKSLGSKRGLARVEPPKGTFVIFAAGVGEQAIDNLGQTDTNPNGLFTRELLSVIAKPGLEIRPMVQQLRLEVREASLSNGNGGQTPSYYDQLLGEFYFLPKSLEPPISEDGDRCGRLVNPQASADEIMGKDLDLGLQACGKALTNQPGEAQFARLLQAVQEQSIFQKALRSNDPSLSNAYLILYPDGRFAANVKTYLASLQPAPVTPPVENIDSTEIARVLQVELKRVGCYQGTTDGSWGAKSVAALKNFASAKNIKLNSDNATMAAVDTVRRENGQTCQRSCQPGSVLSGNVCRTIKKIPKQNDVTSENNPPKRTMRDSSSCFSFGSTRICQ